MGSILVKVITTKKIIPLQKIQLISVKKANFSNWKSILAEEKWISVNEKKTFFLFIQK